MDTQDLNPHTEAQPTPSMDPSAITKPLRTWPALALVILIPIARFGPMLVEDGLARFWMISVFGPLLCCLLLILWWLGASRATWKERIFALLGLVAALTVTLLLVDPSMRGPGTSYFTLPIGMIAFGLAAALLAKLPPKPRTSGILLAATTAFALSLFFRTEGMTGEYVFSIRWRWAPRLEDRLVASPKPALTNFTATSNASTPKATPTQAEWPGFRGADRASRVSNGPVFSTNWSNQPPRVIWKIPVGPGWSSFAVQGTQLFTQEQRGTREAVVCYETTSGREVWIQSLEARFDEPMGGPGPRATPTLSDGKLFVVGATGLFMRLNPADGSILWQKDLKTVANRELPMWGFSGSPLVSGNTVIVYAGGPGDKGLLAFDVDTGAIRWSVAAGNDSYSSPQLTKIVGETCVLMLTNEGLNFLDPSTGTSKLNYLWKHPNYRALQPQLIQEDTILIPTPMNEGSRAIRITKDSGNLKAEALWTTKHLKTDFSDFVTYQGHAYGMDGGVFTCVELKAGERQWKGGRYGKGQVLLLESSGLLLVAAESGDIVLLRADPKAQMELGTFKAIEGKSWNQPVVVGDRLYLRNSQEAACILLPVAEGNPSRPNR